MKITRKGISNYINTKLVIAFDVGKKKLNCYSEIPEQGIIIEDEFCNKTKTIQSKLHKFDGIAREYNLKGIHIICEPTGNYHRILLQTARSFGHTTAFVNAESVNKLKVVESNDSGKTDIKDPRVILMLYKLGKTLIHRNITDEYLLLREYNKMYEEVLDEMVRIRCRIHDHLLKLFPDRSFSNDVLYGKSGFALLKVYNANPYKIVKNSSEYFCKRMRRAEKGIKKTSLQQIYEDAKSSVLHQIDEEYISVLEQKMKQLWSDLGIHRKRKDHIVKEMTLLYQQLQARYSNIPNAKRGILNEFQLARVLGETGPLTDFSNIQKLYRYAGLNIRERKSGQYKGLNKISRKGRSLLRNILGKLAFSLVKRDRLFGEYYHSKKDSGMLSSKAMVSVERKVLKMIYGLSKQEKDFDIQRVFICKCEYDKDSKQLQEAA